MSYKKIRGMSDAELKAEWTKLQMESVFQGVEYRYDEYERWKSTLRDELEFRGLMKNGKFVKNKNKKG